jgi:uncharacterized BrkB/YihY/UPF0761 family membrane protein
VSVEAGFRWLFRDKQIAGGVLGGGLAYRFFFWTLALSLLGAGGLGFAERSNADIESAAASAGLTDAVGGTIATAARQSENGRWWLLSLGIVFTVWFSWSLLRALRLVHAAAWRIAAPAFRNVPRALAVVIAAPVVIAACVAAAGWVRDHSGFLPGLLATLGVCLAFGAAWLWISTKLPAPPVRWTAFVPGAVVFAVGLEALHLFTAYFLAAKLASQSALYGALGLAASLLFYLFLIGRGVVWAAELNAVVWEVRNEPEHRREPRR